MISSSFSFPIVSTGYRLSFFSPLTGNGDYVFRPGDCFLLLLDQTADNSSIAFGSGKKILQAAQKILSSANSYYFSTASRTRPTYVAALNEDDSYFISAEGKDKDDDTKNRFTVAVFPEWLNANDFPNSRKKSVKNAIRNFSQTANTGAFFVSVPPTLISKEDVLKWHAETIYTESQGAWWNFWVVVAQSSRRPVLHDIVRTQQPVFPYFPWVETSTFDKDSPTKSCFPEMEKKMSDFPSATEMVPLRRSVTAPVYKSFRASCQDNARLSNSSQENTLLSASTAKEKVLFPEGSILSPGLLALSPLEQMVQDQVDFTPSMKLEKLMGMLLSQNDSTETARAMGFSSVQKNERLSIFYAAMHQVEINMFSSTGLAYALESSQESCPETSSSAQCCPEEDTCDCENPVCQSVREGTQPLNKAPFSSVPMKGIRVIGKYGTLPSKRGTEDEVALGTSSTGKNALFSSLGRGESRSLDLDRSRKTGKLFALGSHPHVTDAIRRGGMQPFDRHVVYAENSRVLLFLSQFLSTMQIPHVLVSSLDTPEAREKVIVEAFQGLDAEAENWIQALRKERRAQKVQLYNFRRSVSAFENAVKEVLSEGGKNGSISCKKGGGGGGGCPLGSETIRTQTRIEMFEDVDSSQPICEAIENVVDAALRYQVHCIPWLLLTDTAISTNAGPVSHLHILDAGKDSIRLLASLAKAKGECKSDKRNFSGLKVHYHIDFTPPRSLSSSPSSLYFPSSVESGEEKNVPNEVLSDCCSDDSVSTCLGDDGTKVKYSGVVIQESLCQPTISSSKENQFDRNGVSITLPSIRRFQETIRSDGGLKERRVYGIDLIPQSFQILPEEGGTTTTKQPVPFDHTTKRTIQISPQEEPAIIPLPRSKFPFGGKESNLPHLLEKSQEKDFFTLSQDVQRFQPLLEALKEK